MKRLALAIAAVAGLVVLWASPASAHNTLVEATPAKDAAFTEPPVEVKLRFLSSLKPDTKLTVTDAQGVSAIGEVKIDGKFISAPFTGKAGGAYTVGYELVSDDGHTVRNTYSFTLRLPQTQAPSLSPSPSASPSPAVVTAPAAEQEKSTPWFPYIGGAVVAGLVVGGVIAFLRRNRTP